MRRTDYDLRRRRVAGVCLLAVFLVAGLALNGWTVTPIWALLDSNEGTFVAGDPFGEWIYVVCDGERQQVTVSRGGRLAGADALDSVRTARLPGGCDLPIVDNPDLADWQARLDRLTALTTAPGSSGREILSVAREMPIAYLYLKPLSDWIHDGAANAAAFLDAVAERPMRFDHPDWGVVLARRQAFAGLIRDALDIAAAHEVSPDRLERWFAEEQIAGADGAVQRLLRMGQVSDGAAARALERLEAVPPRQRAELYSLLAARLVHDERFAPSLAEQLTRLPPPERSAAARRLLARTDVPAAFPAALLYGFRRTFGHEPPDAQLDVFTAAAARLRHESEAPTLLATRLKDLPDAGPQRRMAATFLLSLDDTGESRFALAVLRAFADLHPISRPKVLHALLQSPQFGDRAVQEACLLAVQLETQGPERHELLQAMLRHRGLAEDLHSRIRAELGRFGPPWAAPAALVSQRLDDAA